MDLEEELGLTYMFITHDMSVVKHISNRIMVMYLGKCVEVATSDELFGNPQHPYTKALLSAIPVPDLSARDKDFVILRGEVSNPINVKPGCRFAKRCDYCTEACTAADPEAVEVSPGHFVSCVLMKKEA
jgi:oligopeptide/dipeptide ABC transporter ATP-binding protein